MLNMELHFSSIQVSIAFLLIFVTLRTWNKSKTKKATPVLPPGPWRLPIIGNIHLLVGKLPHHCLRELAKVYGPVMHLQLGETSNLIISSPEAAKEVMKTHDALFAQRPFHLVARIIFYNATDIAFAPYGEYWRQLRKICILELLSAKRVQSFRSIRKQEVSNLIGSLSSSAGSPVNLSKMILETTFRSILKAAFGDSQKQQDAFVPLAKKIMLALEGFGVADAFPSMKFLHVISGTESKLKRLHQELDNILESIINEHREKKELRGNGSNGETDDLVDVLLNLQQEGNLEIPLTTDNMKAVILDIFIAGVESSSTVLEWAMSEMMRDPRVMKKAQSEVSQLFHNDETGLDELKYLNSVIKETLRLHPPGPLLIPRENQEKVEFFGYEVPAKTRVIINAWAIGRDPSYWTEAERFYPDRFLGSGIDYKGTNFEYIPFGAGRRICPGLLFGTTVVQVFLATLLYHFDWELPNGTKPENLDMSEAFGAAVRRKNHLYLIPVPHHHRS